MTLDNEDLNPLEYKNYTTVLERLEVKDKKMYCQNNRAGEAFHYAMFKYYEPLVNKEQVQDAYNYTKFSAFGKARVVNLILK